MPQYREAKLQMLLELTELDPNLLSLALVVGTKAFGKILKSLAGMTFTIPTYGKIKAISAKVSDYRHSFEKMARSNGKNPMLRYMADLGRLIDCKDVREATKEVVTQAVLQEYLKGLFADDNAALKWTVEEIEELPTDDKLELYKLGVKELELKSTIFEKLETLSKKKKLKEQSATKTTLQ
jgi:hypothetical protein